MIGAIGIWQLVAILIIVVVVVGTRKVKWAGRDTAQVLKDFRNLAAARVNKNDTRDD